MSNYLECLWWYNIKFPLHLKKIIEVFMLNQWDTDIAKLESN